MKYAMSLFFDLPERSNRITSNNVLVSAKSSVCAVLNLFSYKLDEIHHYNGKVINSEILVYVNLDEDKEKTEDELNRVLFLAILKTDEILRALYPEYMAKNFPDEKLVFSLERSNFKKHRTTRSLLESVFDTRREDS